MRDVVSRQTPPFPDLAYRQYEPSLESEEVHLRDYLGILTKRYRLVIGIFLLVLFVGFCALFPVTPQYRASATLKIEPQNPLTTVNEAINVQYNTIGSYDYYKTQFELLKSRRLAKKVVSDLNLGANPSFLSDSPPTFLERLSSLIQSYLSAGVALVTSWLQPPAQVAASLTTSKDDSELKLQELVSRYLPFLHVDPIRDTRLVRIEFTTSDPQLSQTLANAHAETFIRTSIETRFDLTKEARDFLEKKLTEIKGRLERSERELDKFRRDHGVVSLEGNDNVVANRMLDLNRRLIEARDKRIEVESLYYALKDKNSQNLSKIIDNERIQQLKGRLDTLEVEYARLGVMFKADHPSLRELSTQIAEARQRFEKEIVTVQRGIESDYRVARYREETLTEAADREQEAALNLKRIGIEYTILDQEAKAQRVLYERLLQRLNETNISNTTTVSNVDIAEEALPGVLVPSGASLKFLVFAVFGLLLGGGVAFTAEYFNSVVETPETVWRSIGVPTLGVVPHLRSLRQSPSVSRWLPGSSSDRQDALPVGVNDSSCSAELILFHQQLSAFPESYRTIRTALLYSQETPPPPVILVTSAHPDEGKTVTTLNLAITLAQNNYNVLIVDADLRKGNCHTLLQMDNFRGLSNVLCDQESLQACIRPTLVHRLSLLSRGDTPPNPADLLGSLRMKEILTELRGLFDFVLIDSPPALVVSDATVLATQCDGVLLVINGQKTTAPMVQLLRERLEAVRAPLVGVILNAVNLRNPNYAYYRSYYKSYPTTAVRPATSASPGKTEVS